MSAPLSVSFRCQLINYCHPLPPYCHPDYQCRRSYLFMPGHHIGYWVVYAMATLLFQTIAILMYRMSLYLPSIFWYLNISRTWVGKMLDKQMLSVLLRFKIMQWDPSIQSLHFSSSSGSLGVRMKKVNWSVGLGLGFGGEGARACSYMVRWL